MSTDRERPAQNPDRELWRRRGSDPAGDYYAPSIHVTEGGAIGINVGGYVIVKSVEDWHALAKLPAAPREPSPPEVSDEFWRRRMAYLFRELPFPVRHRWGGDVDEFIEGIDYAIGQERAAQEGTQ